MAFPTTGRRLRQNEYDNVPERYIVACYNYGQMDPVARDAFSDAAEAQERENYWRTCGYWRVITFDCGTPEERA